MQHWASLFQLRRNPMATRVATGPDIEVETFSEARVASLPSPRRIMIFTVHWSKDGGSDETHRISPVVAVAKARELEASGYRVRITDRRGRQFTPSEFGELLH